MNKMKILKKIRHRDSREIHLFGHKVFSYSRASNKKEKYSLSLYEYLDGYKDIIKSYDEADPKHASKINDEQSEVGQKILFQYWNSGEENAPALVKNCFKSVEQWCTEYKIVRLNDSNLQEYIDIPEHILEKYRSGVITKAHFSDYVRTCLLLKWGGIWCDATVYMTGPIPKEISDADFFMFKSDSFCITNDKNKGYVPSIKMLDVIKDLPSSSNPIICGSSWFLAASKRNLRVLNLVKLILEEYWKKEDHLIDYFLFHYVLTYVVLTDQISKKTYSVMPNYCNFNPHLLLNMLYDRFNEDLFNEVKSLSAIHKLTYQKNADIEGTFIEHLLDNK